MEDSVARNQEEIDRFDSKVQGLESKADLLTLAQHQFV